MIGNLEKGKTINTEYYCNLLDQFNKKILEKRIGIVKKKIIVHLDTTLVHLSVLIMAKVNELQKIFLVDQFWLLLITIPSET